jgi:hypothetical protein
MCTRSVSKVPSRLSPYLMAPSGLIRVGRTTQGKPWVNPGLRSFGHFGPRIRNVQTPGHFVSRPFRAKRCEQTQAGSLCYINAVAWSLGVHGDSSRDSSKRSVDSPETI